MKHSLISWDSTYRDFFHLIDGALNQDYPADEYELIYIEQRSKEFADEYAESEGVKSLSDRHEEVKDKINFRVEYLDDPLSNPYHLGKCNNRGLELAQGEYISVMDGDQLLPPDFLSSLDDFFNRGGTIANVVRRMADEPVGVPKSDWKEAKIDFDSCLNMCPGSGEPIPEAVKNKGPLISAHRSHWDAVRGYSEHKVWSTGLSRLGQDVCKRLELETGTQSKALPDTVTVHPWHPSGFSRSAMRNRKLLYIQKQLIEWTEQNEITDWNERVDRRTEDVYQQHQDFVDMMIAKDDLALPGQTELSQPSPIDKVIVFVSEAFGRFLYS